MSKASQTITDGIEPTNSPDCSLYTSLICNKVSTCQGYTCNNAMSSFGSGSRDVSTYLPSCPPTPACTHRVT
jgi:hypothetical protein